MYGLAEGPDSSVYLEDSYAHRVRRVAPDGTIYAFAGTGEKGFSGDGGPAVQAQLYYPRGVAVGADGSVYITDSSNRRIRKVSPAGIITTIAGDGSYSWPQQGVPAASNPFTAAFHIAVDSKGDLIVGTWSAVFKVTSGGRVYRIAGQSSTGFGGDGGLATDGKFDGAWGVAVNAAGHIFVSDEDNDRVRRLRPDRAALMEAVSGTEYAGLVGQPMSDPPRVRVIGSLGLPLPQQLVVFTVASGSATITTPNVMTDEFGIASAA